MFNYTTQNMGLFCLDYPPSMLIRGFDNFDYVRLDIIYQPSPASVSNNVTFTQAMQYLGTPELYLVYNQQRLTVNEFFEDFIINEAVVYSQHLQIDRARILKTVLQRNTVEDSTSLLPMPSFDGGTAAVNTNFTEFIVQAYEISAYNIFP